jgi:NO-binding membrane sensor protein with MHYT domain
MLFGLRRYDAQARYAAVLAVLSVVPAVMAVTLALRNYQRELGQIVYGQGGYFVPALLGCVLGSVASAGLAFVLGWSSLGQRRNDRPARSWIGFFVGGVVLTLNLIVLIAFWMLRLQRPA